jgi:thiol-disulfide isomerase/thioredoxin
MNDGTHLTGSQLRQGTSCIVFFTTACPDCREVLPHIQELYKEYSSKGVQFALISREDGPETVENYWIEKKYTMPFSAQSDRKVYELFAKTRVPRIYICREGLIRSIFTDTPLPTAKDLSDSLKKSVKL